MEARSRIAQEAVNDALKHARARLIRVRLLRKRNKVELQIDDDGPGLLVTRKSRQGRGLTIMLHHAQLIGASLALESEPRRGTPVTCHLPGPPILVLSMHDEKSFAERVLRAGARDYVTKDAGSAKVLEVIQQAAREARLDFFAPSPHHELKAAQADFHCRTGMVTPRHRSAGRGGRTRVLAHETLNFFTMPGPPFNPDDRSE